MQPNRIFPLLVLAALLSLASPVIGDTGTGPILGIHTNAKADSDFAAGHAWITITENGVTQTIGLWPDNHPDIPDNGAASDVRFDKEPNTGVWNRYYELSAEQLQSLQDFIGMNHTWTCTNNCASFASDAVAAAVGEDVDADEFLGFETPREICDSIDSLEAGDPSTAICPAAGFDSDASSSSTCSSEASAALCSFLGNVGTCDAVFAGMSCETSGRGVCCRATDSGDPIVCDATDAWQASFLAVDQSGSLVGYDLYRFGAQHLSAPIISGGGITCQVADVPQATLGIKIEIAETDDGLAVVAPAVGTVHYYLVTHSRATGGGVVPAGRARPRAGQGFVPRFMNPPCQQPNP